MTNVHVDELLRAFCICPATGVLNSFAGMLRKVVSRKRAKPAGVSHGCDLKKQMCKLFSKTAVKQAMNLEVHCVKISEERKGFILFLGEEDTQEIILDQSDVKMLPASQNIPAVS